MIVIELKPYHTPVTSFASVFSIEVGVVTTYEPPASATVELRTVPGATLVVVAIHGAEWVAMVMS